MSRLIFVFLLGFSLQAAANPHAGESLPKLKIDSTRITVSGISSGAYFSVQYHLAHSDYVQGAGVVAGGIYWCAEGSSLHAQMACMSLPSGASLSNSLKRARTEEEVRGIDSLENLKDDKVYIFGSTKDSVVNSRHSDLLEQFYGNFMPAQSIQHIVDNKAAHGFLTDDFGNNCGTSGAPWIQNCGVKMAQNILDQLDENPKESPPGQLSYFDQTPFILSGELYSWGAVYVPKNCMKQKCGLHIAFHGCQQNPDFVDEQFIREAGYQAAADSHGLVVLFPQSSKATGNPYACWDWYGVHGGNYANQGGAQIKAIDKMVQAISN